jgi:hypothetical protein
LMELMDKMVVVLDLPHQSHLVVVLDPHLH